MTRRHLGWLIAVGVLAAVDLGLTIHAHETWKQSPNGPSTASLGQVLGWVTSVGLIVVFVLLAIGARRSVKRRQNAFRPH
jgi:uncharacterized membrane protein